VTADAWRMMLGALNQSHSDEIVGVGIRGEGVG
jgi:hypothetical protein